MRVRRALLALALGLLAAAPATAQTEVKRNATLLLPKFTPTPRLTCPAPQVAFERADGKLVCIAPDANPCPAGQTLVKSASSGLSACTGMAERRAFTCPAPQIVFQKADGSLACIAPDANPCPPRYVLGKSSATGRAECKPAPARTPFACPAPQVVFQKPDGSLACIAPDANPCPAGYGPEKSATGRVECRPLPDRRAFTCPPGQVRVQKPDGRFVCVAGS
jgi:hypothetical protein